MFKPGEELTKQIRGEYGATIAAVVFAVWLIYGAIKVWGSIAETAASFVTDPEAESSRGSMQDVSQQLGRLIDQATRGRRLVIFVDDLERCKPPRAIEVCEAASQLLGHPRVVTVLIGDMAVIATSADIKYRDLELRTAEPMMQSAYGRRYLEKIVQIQFDLPFSGHQNIRRIVEAPDEEDGYDAEKAQRKGRDTDLGLEDQRSYMEKLKWRIPSLVRQHAGAIVASSMLWMYAGLALLLLEEPTGRQLTPRNEWADLALFLGLPFLIIAVPGLLRDLLRSITQRIQADIDREIRTHAAETDLSILDVERRVAGSRSARRGGPWLVRQRVRLYLVEESPLQRDALAEIKQHLPTLPRNVKRMYNHLHLVLSIAVGRAALGGSPKLEPRHIGKWVVLIERWPELRSLLSSIPEVMSKLEMSGSTEELEHIVDEISSGLNISPSEELYQLATSDPKLSEVLDRLIHLSPVGRDLQSSEPHVAHLMD